jgi:hypothetical protein
VLDLAHRLVLQGVDQGDCDDCPALRTLLATGLVEQQPDGGYVVTQAGRVALQDGESDRRQRIVWRIVGVCAAAYVVVTVIDRVT